MGSLDSRVGHLEQRRNELQAEIDGFADAMAALEARVAALEQWAENTRLVAAEGSPEQWQPMQAARPAPQQRETWTMAVPSPKRCEGCEWLVRHKTGEIGCSAPMSPPYFCPAPEHPQQPRGGGG